MGSREIFHEYKVSVRIGDKEHRDIAHNNNDKKQKEPIAVTITADRLMKKISVTAGSVLRHLRQSRWEPHMRRFKQNTFTEGIVGCKADFSATLDIHPQDELSCAIPAHAIQNVMIFSLNPFQKNVINKSEISCIKRFLKKSASTSGPQQINIYRRTTISITNAWCGLSDT